MIKRQLFTAIFYALCILGVLGFIKTISAQKYEISQIIQTKKPETGPTREKIIIPISDEEIFPQETPTEITSNQTEESQPKSPEEGTTDQKTTEEKINPCPAGNEYANYSELSPVSPNFGINYYVPNDLLPIPKKIPTPHTTCIRIDTLVALEKMYDAMKLEKLQPMVVSGFRSSTYQKEIQGKNISQKLADGTVTRSVALPHHSEHQLGTTIDLAAPPYYNIRDFENSAEYAWMIQHAHEYGFVQSYHYGQEKYTGYRGEPWHWRYIGVEHATNVATSGSILFQYLEEYLENSKIKTP